MLHTWLINISGDIRQDKWQSLLNHIEVDRRNSIDKFRSVDDKKRSLIAGLLVKAMTNESHPNKNLDISYFKNYYGKPYIKGVSGIYFNISHSGDYVCCAISDSEVGIDVEEIKTSMEIDTFKYFFSFDEWEQVLDKKNDSHDTFFSLWTLKESYIKKIGRGLSKQLNSFSILLGDQIGVEDYEIEKTDVHFLLRDIGSSYKLAICSEKCMDNVEEEMTVQEFLDRCY